MDDGTTVSALRHCQRPPDLDELMNTAANRIAALEAENERLRKELAHMTTKGDVLNIDAFREVSTENGGWWDPCSGCHESYEGVPSGEYSKAMRCHRGSGCDECGGLGAVWHEWTAFDEGYYNALKDGRTEQEALEAGAAARAALQENDNG